MKKGPLRGPLTLRAPARGASLRIRENERLEKPYHVIRTSKPPRWPVVPFLPLTSRCSARCRRTPRGRTVASLSASQLIHLLPRQSAAPCAQSYAASTVFVAQDGSSAETHACLLARFAARPCGASSAAAAALPCHTTVLRTGVRKPLAPHNEGPILVFRQTFTLEVELARDCAPRASAVEGDE